MESSDEAMLTLTGADHATDQLTYAATEDDMIAIAVNKDAGTYELLVNGQTAAGLLYTETGKLVTIRSTAVFREFRGTGMAGRLLGGVLDMLHGDGRVIVLTCPFCQAFIRNHPEYVDAVYPSFPRKPHLHSHGSLD